MRPQAKTSRSRRTRSPPHRGHDRVTVAPRRRGRVPPHEAALLGAIWIQIGTNFANDVFDYEKGADTAERLGPTRATQAGLLTPSQTRAGMIVSFLLATIAGIYLVMVGGWPVVAIGVLSIASGIAYTGGPFPLGYNGLGDVFVMIFFGFVAVCGTVYVQTRTWEWAALWAAVGIGGLACAILVANNLRDIPTDRIAGKLTLAVRLGDTRTRLLYVALVAVAVLAVVAVAVATTWWALIGLGFFAVALEGVRTVRSGAVGPALIPALQQTGRAELVWAVLVAVPLILA